LAGRIIADFFGTDRPDFYVLRNLCSHDGAGFQEYNFLNSSTLSETQSPGAIAAPDVQHGMRFGRNLLDNEFFDGCEIFAVLRG
jgi:hypothetical protein